MDGSRVKSSGKFLMKCILLWLRMPLPTLFKDSLVGMPLEKQESIRTKIAEKIFYAIFKMEAMKAFLLFQLYFNSRQSFEI